jgi:chromosome segregation ATPase
MRPFNEDKTWGDKQKKEYILDKDGNKIYDKKTKQYKCKSIPTTDWNEQTKAEEWRAAWADYVNGVLEHNNHAERIDHRSYERQGINQIPTVHLGTAASQMEKRGIRTERGNINREIEVTNQRLRQLKARIVKLQSWLKEEQDNIELPTLTDIITNILERREQTGTRSRYGTIHNLKAAANILNFLTSNKIFDMAGLAEKLDTMTDKQFTIRDELKKVERRLKTLDEHIRHSGNFKGYRGHNTKYEKLYAQYTTIKKAGGFGVERKAQKALTTANEYHETYRIEIAMYENAEKYLREVMQGHFDIKKLPPITKWQAEREKLTADYGNG